MRRTLIGALTVALIMAITTAGLGQGQLFAPNGNYTTIAASAVSTRTALPTGAAVVVYNTSAPTTFCRLGDSAVVATTSNEVITSGAFIGLTVGSNTFIACITSGPSTTLNISGGQGTPSGAR